MEGVTSKQTVNMEKQALPGFVRENDYFSVYPGPKMTIFITRRPYPVLKGEFSHKNYEFIVSLSPILGFTVGGIAQSMPEKTLLPVNSDQEHGTRLLISDVSFMNIQFEAEFLQELLFGIYGVRDVQFINEAIPCGEDILALARSFMDEYDRKREGFSYNLSNLSIQIAIAIFRLTGISDQIVVQKPQDFVSKTIAHFSENYEESFSLDALSKVVNMSKYNFARKFKDMTGKTPYAYFQDIRVMKALELLSNPVNRVIDVALQCGFKNHSHFTQLFRQRTGLTPTEYRTSILAQ